VDPPPGAAADAGEAAGAAGGVIPAANVNDIGDANPVDAPVAVENVHLHHD